jgi:hypothetical protein
VYIKTFRKEKSVEKKRGARGGMHGGNLQGQEGKMAVLTHLEKGSHRMSK